jgi:hypothetical protein
MNRLADVSRQSRKLIFGALVALAAAAALMVAAASPAAARNLQPMGPAPGPCTPGQTTPCTFNSRCAQMSFSPHLVHVGEDIVSSAGPAVNACGPGGIEVIGWSWGPLDGLSPVRACPNTKRPSECRFKAVSPTLVPVRGSSTALPGFTIGCINGGSGFGPWMSCDYYGIIGDKQRAISGSVQTKRGKPVNNVEIIIDGPSGGTVRTNSNGDYYAVVDAGQYRVSVNGIRDSVAFCSGGERGAVCDLDVSHSDGQADFTVPPDKIELHFSPSHAAADGLSHFEGTVDVVNSAGQPGVGTDVKLTPPLDAAPRALVCAGGKVVYPQLLSDGTVLGSQFTQTTDANGQIPMTIWPGTVSGHWLFDASEATDSSVSNSASFPFDTANEGRFPALDGFGAELYNGLRASQSTTKVHVLFQFGQNSTEAANQDVLLQWLIASGRSYFPGTDFGPVSYAGHAGVLFYPHGSLTPTAGPTSVIDLRDAEAIVDAAANGTAVPPANDTSRSLADWAMYVSGSHTPPPLAQTLGPAAQWTGQQYAYFGFPYPQSALNPAGQVEFYNSCAAPDGTPQIVQTHSPVSLVFRSASGDAFGLDANGNRVGNGTGIAFRAHDQTTYLVPAGRYSTMSVTGTGSGTAHIEVFGIVGAPLTSYVRKVSNYAFTARKGVTGALPVNFFGPAGGLVYAGRSVKQQFGLPLQLAGVPRRLRHGKRTLKLTVTTFGTSVTRATVSVRYKGHLLVAQTDSRGRVRFTAKLPHGKLSISVTFPGAATARSSLSVQ